jgi:hypothetical protein
MTRAMTCPSANASLVLLHISLEGVWRMEGLLEGILAGSRHVRPRNNGHDPRMDPEEARAGVEG